MTNPAGDTVTWRGVEKLDVGVYPPPSPAAPPAARAEAALGLWCTLLRGAGGNVVRDRNVVSKRYEKNVWTATQAALQGLTRTPQPCFAHVDAASQLVVRAFMAEVVALGYHAGLLSQWEGIAAQPADPMAGGPDAIVQGMWDKFVSKPDPAKTHKWSMLVDIEQGRPFEVEVVLGAVVRLADERDFPVPNTRFAYALLKGMQQGILHDIHF